MELYSPVKLVPARLVLKNGEVYEGVSPDWFQDDVYGEVVFTTGMMGYVESLTDPSYAGQILNFTFPLIGNYGVPEQKEWESSKIHARGVVLSEICPFCDHYQAKKTLADWLKSQNVPFISGVDTRALTKSLRRMERPWGQSFRVKKDPRSFPDPNQTHLVASVSTKKALELGKGKKKIIAVDCGMKENIIRQLLQFPISIKRVPFDYDYSEGNLMGSSSPMGPAILWSARRRSPFCKKR